MSTSAAPRQRATLSSYGAVVDGPLLVASFAFLLAWTILMAVADLPELVHVALVGLLIALWILFAADLVVRLTLAEHPWRWAAQQPLQVLGVFIPPLYPFKLLAVMTRETFKLGGRGLLKTGQAVVIAAAVLTWTCALAVLHFERGAPGHNIQNFGDSIWWACVTVTSVGYGDFSPVTVMGRFAAGLLMFAGLAFLGVITATVAAWIISLTSADSTPPKVIPLEESVNEALAKAEASKAANDNGGLPAG